MCVITLLFGVTVSHTNKYYEVMLSVGSVSCLSLLLAFQKKESVGFTLS